MGANKPVHLASKDKGIAHCLPSLPSSWPETPVCGTKGLLSDKGWTWGSAESCCILLSVGFDPIFLKRKLGAQKASVIFPRSDHLENGGVKMRMSIK